MKKFDEASPIINLAGLALLVKMPITLEQRGAYVQILNIYVFNIGQPLLCKTLTRLYPASFWPVEPFWLKMLIPLKLCDALHSNFV